MASDTVSQDIKTPPEAATSDNKSIEQGHVVDADDGLLETLGYKQVRTPLEIYNVKERVLLTTGLGISSRIYSMEHTVICYLNHGGTWIWYL